MALGLPSVSIQFIQEGITAIQRGSRGVVGLIIEETTAMEPVSIAHSADIPEGVSEDNKQLILNALIGNTNAPRKLELFIMSDGKTLQDAQNYFENTYFDYLAYPEAADEDKTALVSWVKSIRDLGVMRKVVLANVEADHEGVVNVTQEGVVVGEKTYSAAEFTARVAGLICGTDLRIATTYANVPEVDSIPFESREATATRVGNGEFVLLREAGKVKVARGVNSLQTTSGVKGTLFQKLKTVDIMDMIANDIKTTARDNYLGKYANSYDNKCLLITAIKGYLEGLVNDGLVEKNTVVVDIDIDVQRAYLKSIGTDVVNMDDQEIKEANTEDKVFIKVSCKVLDAIEEIQIKVYI